MVNTSAYPASPHISNIFRILAVAIVLLVLFILSASGQVPVEGSVQGTVKDSSGAVIPNAAVTLSPANGQEQTTKTDSRGGFAFRHLAPGTYTVSATAPGLEQAEIVLVSLSPNQQASVNIAMAVKTQVQQVTVTGTGDNQVSTEASNNASALVLKQSELDALPDDPDDLEADLEALAGPSAGPGGPQIFIDGFTGGRLPPKSSIREIRINSNPFAAEYDKMGFGRIEIFTKPGTDKFHGQGYFGMSDAIWDSRNPFLTEKPPFKTQLFGGNVSGPLGKRASFFLDLDRRQIDDDGIVNAMVPAYDFLGGQTLQSYYPTPQRRTTVSPRLDFQLSATNTLSLRYAYLANDERPYGIGGYNLPATTINGVVLPSAGYNSSSGENLLQAVDTAVINARTINETHFQFARDSIGEASLSTSPGINVANSFVAGGSGYSAVGYARSYDTQNQYELQNYTSITAGAHIIKFGARVRADVLDDFSPRNFNGTYSFLGNSSGLSSLQQYLGTLQLLNAGYTSQAVTAMGYGPSQYSVNAGNPYIGLSQVDFGPFVQDDWRIKPNLTLSMGLRFEAQTNISDKNDWAPRLGFAWSPDARAGGGRAKTVVRGGFGIFYDRFQIASVANAYRYNGSNQQTYVIEDPAVYTSSFDNPQAIGTLTLSNSEQRYQIDRALHAPMLMQTAIGVERQLFSHTTLSFNFIDSRGVHELRTEDINAPLPGTYTYSGVGTVSAESGIRPFGDIGDIYDYQSTGIFKQTQAMVSVNTAIGRWANIFSRYMHGNAHSDTDGINTLPSNPYNYSSDWGRSSLDISNLLFMGGSILLPKGVRLSPFMIAHSGAPFNITTGTDIYGIGQATSSARPSIVSGPGANIVYTRFGYLDTIPQPGQTIIARNSATGPGFFELNLRLSKTWGFGTTKFEGTSGGSTARQGGGPPGGGPPRQGGGGPPGGGPPGGGPGGGGPPPGMGGESSQHRYNLTLSITARNALNHENEASPVGVVTSPYFLQSTSIAGGFGPESVSSTQRRIDLQIRFTF
jgi:Carboxypeptidase regulatory-like domain